MGNHPPQRHPERETDVLIIDDSASDLRMLVDLMTRMELRLSIALSGEQGCRLATVLQPGLILLDVYMPKLDGFTVCRQIKSDPTTWDIPVIFLTAAADLTKRLEGFAAGGVDYIAKPFEVEEVVARVGVHLYRGKHPVQPPLSGTSPRRTLKELVGLAQRILVAEIESPPKLDMLARRVGTNRRQLNDAFQAYCGQPVFGWLRDERLRQAHALVRNGQLPLGQISDALGYSTPANFAKAFRLRYGCSPSELRASVDAQQDSRRP